MFWLIFVVLMMAIGNAAYTLVLVRQRRAEPELNAETLAALQRQLLGTLVQTGVLIVVGVAMIFGLGLKP